MGAKYLEVTGVSIGFTPTKFLELEGGAEYTNPNGTVVAVGFGAKNYVSTRGNLDVFVHRELVLSLDDIGGVAVIANAIAAQATNVGSIGHQTTTQGQHRPLFEHINDGQSCIPRPEVSA